MNTIQVCRLSFLPCQHQRAKEVDGGVALVCERGQGCQFQAPITECAKVQPEEKEKR